MGSAAEFFADLTSMLRLPDWAGSLVLVLLLVLLPIALLFAWIHEWPASECAGVPPSGSRSILGSCAS